MSDYDLKKMSDEEIMNYNKLVNQRRLEKLKDLQNTGVKFDENKPPMGLIPQAALQEVANVFAYGAKKYTTHNWRLGMDHSRLYDAALRHISQFIDGQDNDAESGLSHLAHAACGILMLLEYKIKKIGNDDRYSK